MQLISIPRQTIYMHISQKFRNVSQRKKKPTFTTVDYLIYILNYAIFATWRIKKSLRDFYTSERGGIKDEKLGNNFLKKERNERFDRTIKQCVRNKLRLCLDVFIRREKQEGLHIRKKRRIKAQAWQLPFLNGRIAGWEGIKPLKR